jgi:hypothetical protein
MWTVVKPNLDVGDTFVTCISKVRSKELKNRLLSIQPVIVSASGDYDVKAQAKSLHRIRQTTSVDNIVSAAEMLAVYDGRMAAKG